MVLSLENALDKFEENNNTIGAQLIEQKRILTANIGPMSDNDKALLIESLLIMGKRYNPSKEEGDRILTDNRAARVRRDGERRARGLPESRPTINNNDQANIDKYKGVWDQAFRGIVPTQRNWRPLIELFREPLKPKMNLVIRGRWNGTKFANSKMAFMSFTIQEAAEIFLPIFEGVERMIVQAMRGTTPEQKFHKVEQKEDFQLANLDRFPTPSQLPVLKSFENFTNEDFFGVAYFPRIVAFRQCTNVIAKRTKEDVDVMNRVTTRYLRLCQNIWIALFGGVAPGANATNGRTAAAASEALINPLRIVISSLRAKKGNGTLPGNRPREDIVIDLVATDTILA